jgi:hypothetical protein
MANVPIRQMFAVCGMTNGPVIRIPGQPAINPAAKFVESLGIDDPVQLLNFTVDDVLDMVKAHNRESIDGCGKEHYRIPATCISRPPA